MNGWQIISLVSLLAWLLLAMTALNRRNVPLSFVWRSALAWGAIIAVIFVLVSYRVELRALWSGFAQSIGLESPEKPVRTPEGPPERTA